MNRLVSVCYSHFCLKAAGKKTLNGHVVKFEDTRGGKCPDCSHALVVKQVGRKHITVVDGRNIPRNQKPYERFY